MPDEDIASFAEFIRRIRAGDGQAAAEMVRRYEPLIRREVRLRTEDRRLERVFDSMDVCQSVLASFFVRTAAGQYDLDRPDQLVGLLITMARNKLAATARQQYRQRRDSRRQAGDRALDGQPAAGPSPSAEIAGRELLDRFHAGLDDDERRLVELRNEGLTWREIADRVGGSAQARRVQLARAVDRVVQELGLDEPADD